MAGDAELVLAGGAVCTLDPARPWASAVALRGGRIALVGSDAEALRLRGPRTQVIDLRGRMLLPGSRTPTATRCSAGPSGPSATCPAARRSPSTAS